jgi:hypothetical protein
MRAIILVSAVSVILVAACAGDPVPALTGSGSGAGAGTGATSGNTGVGGSTGTNTGPSTTATTGTGGQDGRAFFEANVSPFLDDGVTGAACATCHSSQYADPYAAPDFLGSSPTTFYDFLVGEIEYVNANPSSSKFLTRGLHTGPAFTAPQAQLVTQWLEIEALKFQPPATTTSATGTGGGTPTGATGEELLQQFSDCMTIDDWTANGMQNVALNGTITNGPCYMCHQSGVGANFMTDPANGASLADGFEFESNMPFLQNLVTYAVDPQTGQATGIVQSHRWVDKGGEGTSHPKYILAPQNLAAIDNWFTVVNTKCFPPGM